MAQTYATPGIYVEEVSTLPPSVVEAGTAIPAFIGYTLNKPGTGPEPVCLQVNSLREYEEYFGKTLPLKGKLTKTDSGFTFNKTSTTASLAEFSEPDFYLWYSIDHYFRNGGGRCYVISVGKMEDSSISKIPLMNGLTRLEQEDEPTLIVIPDAHGLSNNSDKYEVYTAAIKLAAKLMDRFTIIDLNPIDEAGKYVDTTTKSFRSSVALTEAELSYSGTYAPALKSTITYLVDEKFITINPIIPTDDSNSTPENTNPDTVSGKSAPESSKSDTASSKSTPENPKSDTLKSKSDSNKLQTLSDLQAVDTSLYNQAIKFMDSFRLILPPSAAVAGAITSIDRTRGVWKAPANVPLQSVIAPLYNFTDEEQAGLNVDSSGKSINIIRSFPGRGNLIWGARTMAGNSNEWRYVSVRRLFATVEENINKATAFAVFEPNDISTWLKVKGMIDSYLYSLWQRGALQGASAEEAYFVDIGLGKTMTQADINEGKMIIVIGLAASRPAEFIIIRFSHKQAA